MKINTTRFGEIAVTQEKVIHMPLGMPGFSLSRRFVIIHNKENSPFFWYQSLDDPDLAFVITRPELFVADYHPDISDGVAMMSWPKSDQESIELYVLVTIPRGAPERMTGNFIGPLVINAHVRQAVQVVISNGQYSHKTPLLPSVEAVKDQGARKSMVK